MFKPKTDVAAFAAFSTCFTFSQTLTFNDVGVSEAIMTNFPRALITLAVILLHNKIMDVLVTLMSERDLYKTGHLQFVHSLREGIVIIDDLIGGIKLINLAACRMLHLPVIDEAETTPEFDQIELKKV